MYENINNFIVENAHKKRADSKMRAKNGKKSNKK